MALVAASACSQLERSSVMVSALAPIANTLVLVDHFTAGGDCTPLLVAYGVVEISVGLVLSVILSEHDGGLMLQLFPSGSMVWDFGRSMDLKRSKE